MSYFSSGSFHEVKDYIQDYLSQLERKAFLAEDKTELYVLFSSCLEDSIHEKNSALWASDHLKSLKQDGQFLQACLPGRGRHPAPEASVEYLQEMARIRLCLDRAADILSEPWEGWGKSPSAPFLASAQRPRYFEIQGAGQTGPEDRTGPFFSVDVLR